MTFISNIQAHNRCGIWMQNDKERLGIIVDEINYWKEHNLLPAVYCDYLLALYTKGEGASTDSIKTQKHKSILLYSMSIMLLTILIPLTFLVIYFLKFPSLVKIFILFLCIAFTLIMYRFLKKQNYYFHHLALIVLLMLILLTTVFIGTIFTEHQLLMKLIVLLNFVSWSILGRKLQAKYLVVASFIATVFMFIYIVR